ncbi:FecCD family ABC transporter permease [Streptomyces sp. NPDC056500]|uniref:FecCD family ABC transporter permease n=1 Tax=Streptomyces sp. NPDC056500 TaxID=3345840 RepID=UPI00368D8F6D
MRTDPPTVAAKTAPHPARGAEQSPASGPDRVPGAGPAKAVFLVAGVALLLLVAGASVGIGAQTVAPADIWRSFTDYTGADHQLIIRDIRVPRTVLGIGAGAALAVAGALMQTLTRNPLAEPGILGVTAGAGFAITLGTVFGIARSQPAQLALALIGALLAALAVHFVGRTSPLRLVLAGIALSSVLAGVSLGLRLVFPDVFDHFRFWAVGSLAGREQLPIALPMLTIAAALIAAMALTKALNALSLGEDVAHALGIHVVRSRIAVLAVITVLAGAATAVAGPIVFLGLMVPHIARRLAGASVPWLMAYSLVLGPVLLLASDIGARVVLTTGEVPVAVITAFLGAPVLIWTVRRHGAMAP